MGPALQNEEVQVGVVYQVMKKFMIYRNIV